MQYLNQAIVGAFVYMWHQESMNCFGAHLGTVSRFCWTNKTDRWAVEITLRYWTLEGKFSRDPKHPDHPGYYNGSCGGNRPDESLLDNEDRTLIKLPNSLIDHGQKDFEAIPMASSIILSTNHFGDFGQCTVISEIVPELEMYRACETALRITEEFIHQPRTARCLIFFVHLGCTCEAISGEIEVVARAIVFRMKLDVSLEGLRLCRQQALQVCSIESGD